MSAIVPAIFDATGARRNWSWLEATYGAVTYEQVTGPGWALVEIREDANIARPPGSKLPRVMPRVPEAASVLMARAIDAQGNPIEGLHAARTWPDPNLPALPAELQTFHQIGVHGPTNENGDVGFGMGQGDAYAPPSAGASEIWLPENSAIFRGLGWLAGTDHHHLNLVFQWVSDEEPPPDDTHEQIRGHAQAILDLLPT